MMHDRSGGGPMKVADMLKQIRDFERQQRKRDRWRVKMLMQAVQDGDSEWFYDNLTADMMPWEMALRALAKLPEIPIDFQQAFRSAWIETKQLPLKVRSHSLLCKVLRMTFPPYTGPAVRLFRGACFNEHQNRSYSLSWTTDRSTGERFAKDHAFAQCGGNVLLETLAPTAAIITQIKYPEPLTDAEREQLLRQYPGLQIHEFHDEREFLVDRRNLGTITVAQRFFDAYDESKLD
jgi:hypothetical protein